MRLVSERISTPQQLSTLGRLGGFTAAEAERGQRALWLSGDGYRAALFHLGALTRLNELGLLARLSTVGAVSGGSILAALLATKVTWPLHGTDRDWPEQVARPMRAIARRNVRARAFLRKPFPGSAAEAALEERYARELVAALGGEPRWGPNFIFGASGLTLSGLAAGWEECLEWEIDGTAHPPGYPPPLVAETIAAVRTDLDAFGEAEQAVLENHGYLLADAALRQKGLVNFGGITGLPPEPPHPRWMSERRVREALAASSKRKAVGRLRPRRARHGGRSPEYRTADLVHLLERHRPVLQYDSLENFRADEVATICDLALPGRCNTLHRADGTLIAAVEPRGEEAKLHLDFLGGPVYANGVPTQRGDYLDECGATQAADALELWRRPGRADVVYGRTRHDEEGRLWLQYWFFYYFDDKGLLGVEQHEGDWEVLQIRLGEKGRPDAVTFARHSDAERLSWDQVSLAETDDGPAAVVYPARGSHAALPTPGSFAAPTVPDHNDGQGLRVRPRLEVIADDGPGWVLWPGRWGATRRREYFEANSPGGPREHSCWWDPAEMHREARPWGGAASGEPSLAGAPPAPLEIEARQEESLAVIGYGFPEPSDGQQEPVKVVAAPVEADEQLGVASSFPVEGRGGSFALELPPDREWLGVRVCAASSLGVPGRTLTARFERS
ncbi:MAG: hypothetical protein M3Y75_07425 [Actinomycetota bacterium]|nr:hypothetical protein [Actinomycetota bacterium]